MENLKRDLAMFAVQLPDCWSRCGWSITTEQAGHLAPTMSGHVSGVEGRIVAQGEVNYVCGRKDYKPVEQFMLQRYGGFQPTAIRTELLADPFTGETGFAVRLTVNFNYFGTP